MHIIGSIVYSLVLKHMFVNMLLMVRNEFEVPGDFVAFSLVKDSKCLITS